ncbi:hypothetical protein [Curtobacterium sp. MCSS17_015]|uniref:hypothetical protein n=1 Tax=Curtobacterium sp. MCSS17_015 TaxID=2175666 RepID=UPI0011B4DF98|nr:hypothetical protein [Curtobacterium sp. MCSS17_015]WIB26443.1 hypothetical protein DEJ18_15535 [Curtobacterium sp. MCSS17_015]
MRSVRLAYVVPPVLAVVLAFLGCEQLSQTGVVDVSTVVTAAVGSGSTSNGVVAESLERVAREHDATIVRTVADRSAPTRRRTALVTDAPGTRGAAWLRNGYAEFDPSITTAVRPMSALDRYDPAGAYEVVGDEQAAGATEHALVAAGFETTSERVPALTRLGVTAGAEGTGSLIGALVLGCVVLCLVGTVGAPRRTAVRGLHGRGICSVVLSEVTEVRTTLIITAVLAPVVTLGLWVHNGLAVWATFAVAAAVCCSALLVPVVTAHALGTVIASRRSIARTLSGDRPSSALVLVAQLARVPAVVVLVAAVFDLTSAVAVARAGSAEQERRAAGDTVQLWVTPDPRPGSHTQPYWDRIGHLAGRALDQHRALLSAAAEVSTGIGRGTVPALFVDAGYLRRQDLRTAAGDRVTGTGDAITVWTPSGSDIDGAALVRALTEWELRGASPAQKNSIGGGELAPQRVYTYPGDASTASWLTEAVVVVVPTPSRVFTPDQLSAWLSTGDVVFTSERAADRAIDDSGLRDEFSAVVSVGQAAAEQQRHAGTLVVVDVLTVISSAVVAVVLAALAVTAHLRRHGRSVFAEAAAGRSFVHTHRLLLTVEGALLSVAAVVTVDAWWQRRPDGSGAVSVLDPAAQAAGSAAAAAALVVLTVSVVSVIVMVGSARSVVRLRGTGS